MINEGLCGCLQLVGIRFVYLKKNTTFEGLLTQAQFTGCAAPAFVLVKLLSEVGGLICLTCACVQAQPVEHKTGGSFWGRKTSKAAPVPRAEVATQEAERPGGRQRERPAKAKDSACKQM